MHFIESFWHWWELRPLYGDWVGHFCNNVEMRFRPIAEALKIKKNRFGIDLRCIRIKTDFGNQLKHGSRAKEGMT